MTEAVVAADEDAETSTFRMLISTRSCAPARRSSGQRLRAPPVRALPRRRVQMRVETDQRGGEADEGVQRRDELRASPSSEPSSPPPAGSDGAAMANAAMTKTELAAAQAE